MLHGLRCVLHHLKSDLAIHLKSQITSRRSLRSMGTWLLMLVLMTSPLLSSSCRNLAQLPNSPGNQERLPSSGAPVSIRLSVWGSIQEVQVLRALLRDFERQNPNIRVELLHIPDNYFQKLHLLIAGDLAPDVIMINSLNFPIYATHDAFLNLAPWLGKERTDFYPAALDAFTWHPPASVASSASPTPILGAIPRDISDVVVFYNRDMFRQAGVPEPHPGWTWAEFTERPPG